MEIVIDESAKLAAQQSTVFESTSVAIDHIKNVFETLGLFQDDPMTRDIAAEKIVNAIPGEYLTPNLLNTLDYITVFQQLADTNEVYGVTSDTVEEVRKHYVDQWTANYQAYRPDTDDAQLETVIRDLLPSGSQETVSVFRTYAQALPSIDRQLGFDITEGASESETDSEQLTNYGVVFNEVPITAADQVVRIYSQQDFEDLFAFADDWQGPFQEFINAQLRGYYPTPEMRKKNVNQELTMFQWEDTGGLGPAYGTNVPTGVMGLRNSVRNMPAAQVQTLVTKMHMAGIFEQIGGTPDRTYDGNDPFIQMGLNLLMAESVQNGNIGLNEVLRRRSATRLADVNRRINDANISTVQATLRQIGVQFLGRPLTEEEALSVLSGLEQLAPEFAEAQLALGYSPQEIIEDIETITDAEARSIGAQIEERFKSQAIRWRAGNRARGLGEQFAAWKRGADQSVDMDMPLSGLQSSVETVSDVLGDSNGTA